MVIGLLHEILKCQKIFFKRILNSGAIAPENDLLFDEFYIFKYGSVIMTDNHIESGRYFLYGA